MSDDQDELILPPIVNTVQQKEIEGEKHNIYKDNSQDFNDNIDNGIGKTDDNKSIELSKKKEQYKEEINRLKQEIEEKNKELSELQNENNPEYKIPELLGKIEAQRLLEFTNENKISQNQTKIESIRKKVKDLDEQFKYQLKMKEQKINKKLEPFVKKNNDLIQEIDSCKEQMKQLNERVEKSNDNLISAQKEKSEMEELIIKREEKLNIFFDKLNLFEEIIKKKSKMLKENEFYSKELIKIIDQQKEVIKEFENSKAKRTYNNKNFISGNNPMDNERYGFDNEDNNEQLICKKCLKGYYGIIKFKNHNCLPIKEDNINNEDLDEVIKTKIMYKLKNKFKSEILPDWQKDEEIIGGLVFKFDDNVLDTSIRYKLKDLSKNIMR